MTVESGDTVDLLHKLRLQVSSTLYAMSNLMGLKRLQDLIQVRLQAQPQDRVHLPASNNPFYLVLSVSALWSIIVAF
jgi:hypothetical protein